MIERGWTAAAGGVYRVVERSWRREPTCGRPVLCCSRQAIETDDLPKAPFFICEKGAGLRLVEISIVLTRFESVVHVFNTAEATARRAPSTLPSTITPCNSPLLCALDHDGLVRPKLFSAETAVSLFDLSPHQELKVGTSDQLRKRAAVRVAPPGSPFNVDIDTELLLSIPKSIAHLCTRLHAPVHACIKSRPPSKFYALFLCVHICIPMPLCLCLESRPLKVRDQEARAGASGHQGPRPGVRWGARVGQRVRQRDRGRGRRDAHPSPRPTGTRYIDDPPISEHPVALMCAECARRVSCNVVLSLHLAMSRPPACCASLAWRRFFGTRARQDMLEKQKRSAWLRRRSNRCVGCDHRARAVMVRTAASDGP